MMLQLVKTLMLLIVAAPMAAQQTWLVRMCPGAQPVDFDDLPAAVAAAAPGDTIRLIHDSNSINCSQNNLFSAAVIDKPLTIVGMAGSGSPQAWINTASIGGLLQISGLLPGERVVLRGLRLVNINVIIATGPPFGVDASNCAGDIVIDRVNLHCDGNGGATARFVNCANVLVHDSELILGDRPIEVVDSSMLLTNCLVRHVPPWTVFGMTFLNNSVGLHIDHSKVSLVGSVVYGASSYNLFPGSWPVRTGAILDHGTLEVGPGSLLIAGLQQYSSYAMIPVVGSAIYKDPRGVIDSLNLVPPIAKDMPAVLYDQAAPGESFDFILTGPPNGFALMAIGNYRSPSLPTGLGGLSLDPMTINPVMIAPLDGIGEYSGNLAVPPGVGSPFVYGLQSLTLSPGGDFGLSSATPFVLGWQRDLSPY